MKKIAIMAILWLFSRFRYCIRVVFDLHLHRDSRNKRGLYIAS